MIRKMLCGAGALGASMFAATAAWAQEAAEAVADVAAETAAAVAPVVEAAGPIKGPTVEQMATMVNKGDTAWMLVCSALVLMMSIPGLALFYGGLVRTKNMLSVLMQVFMIVSVAGILWCLWGYSMAFTSGAGYEIGGNQFFGERQLRRDATELWPETFAHQTLVARRVRIRLFRLAEHLLGASSPQTTQRHDMGIIR